MSYKRLWLGLAAMITVQISISGIFTAFSPDQFRPSILQSILPSLLGAFVGGTLARKAVLLPAIGFWLLAWTVLTYVLYLMVEPATQSPITSIIQYNWIAFFSSGVATAIGALLGQMFATARSRRATATQPFIQAGTIARIVPTKQLD